MPLNVKGSDSLYWSARLDHSKLKSDSAAVQGVLAGLKKNISRADIFAGLAISAGVAFAAISKGAYDFSRDMEDAMAEVRTLSQATRENYEKMTAGVIEISKKVPEAAQGLAKGLYQTVSAGYDGAEGLYVLNAAAKGAVAGVTDTLTAVDGLTTALNAFKLQASESERVMDMYFKTVELGKTTFPELASSISGVAPLAASMGVELEQVLAALASLTKQGTPTSVAVTQIRAAMLGLTNAFGDGWSKTMTLQEALQKLYDEADGLESVMRERLGGRVEGVMGLLGLAGKNAEMAASDLDKLKNSSGAAGRAFEVMVQTTTNQLKVLHNNVTAKLRPLGERLLEYASFWVRAVNKMFDALEKRAKEKRAVNVEQMFAPSYKGGMEGSTEYGYDMSDVDRIVNKLKKDGVEVQNMWSRVYDAIINPALTAEQQQANLKSLIAEITGEYEKLDNMLTDLPDIAKDAAAGTDELSDSVEKLEFNLYKSAVYMQMFRDEVTALIDEQERAGEAGRSMFDEFMSAETESDLKNRIEKLREFRNEMASLGQDEAVQWADDEIKAAQDRINRDMLQSEKRLNIDLSKLTDERIKDQLRWLEGMRDAHESNSDMWVYFQSRIDEGFDELHRRERERIQSMGQAILDTASFIGEFDADLANAVANAGRLVQDIGRLKQGGLNQFEQFSSYVGIFQAITGTLQTLVGGTSKSGFDQLIEKYDGLISRQERLSSQLQGNERIMSIQEEIRLLNEVAAAYDNQIDLWERFIKANPRDAHIWKSQLDAMRTSAEETRDQISSLESELSRAFTTTTTTAIADSIVEGFRAGKSAAKDFADDFEGMMADALTDMFKRSIFTKYIQSWYDDFAAVMERGGLNEEEYQQLMSGYFDAIEQSKRDFDVLSDFARATGLNLTSTADKRGLSGAIQGITEQTAGVLEGHFNAMRIDMRDLRDVNRSQFETMRYQFDRIKHIDDMSYYLDDIFRVTDATRMSAAELVNQIDSLLILNTRIANNTGLTVRHLQSIDRKMGSNPAFPDDQAQQRAMGT